MKIKELLMKLVCIQSISKNEGEIGRFIFDCLKEKGLSPKMCGDNVYCSIGKGKETLLLTSHMDTVPVCSGWTRKPFKAVEANGRIYGLGANDTKGSLAAMIDTVTNLNDDELDELNGRVVFAGTVQEETTNLGIWQIMEKIGKVDAAVVGEPTGLNICTAMRGLMILKLTAKGRSAHASRPNQGINAIYKSCEDIQRLLGLKFAKSHNLLGKPSIAVTLINGGAKSNVIPGECEFTADIRSTPIYDNRRLLGLVKKAVKSEVVVLSSRLKPKEANERERVVVAARKASPEAKIIGFPAMCDLALIGAPGIIIGPGRFKQSHSPDEFIKPEQVAKASSIYRGVIENYFKL